MPSVEHELLVAIVREHPELVLALMRYAFGVAYVGEVEVTETSENLSEVRAPERRADAVLVLRDPGAANASAALVVEVQLRPDARKRFSWPAYVAVTRARLQCPVSLVVIALDATAATWCAEPIHLDHQGSVVQPLVIGPARVPIVDRSVAERHPELAVLSLLAHRHEAVALDLGRAVLSACRDLDEARAELYADVVFGFVNEAARRALEAEMKLENYQVQSEFMRNLKAEAHAQREQALAAGRAEGLAEGLAEGHAEGLAEGLAEGHAEGLAEGHAEGLARAVLKLLDIRGLTVTDAQRAAITSCTDPDALEHWLERAATATSADELFPS